MTNIDFENPPFDLRAAGLKRPWTLDTYLSARDYVSFPAHEATYAHLRPGLLHPKLDSLLASQYENGVYKNQKLMIEAAVDGKNVIATTATGSGKSLGFMVPAFNKILTDPAARVIAFYPLRALGQDQIGKWFRMGQDLELDPKLVQRIDGSVLPAETRFKKLRDARIILVTPDVMHAWFMGALDRPEVRDFLKDTRLKIIDEVQAYNGVFGTNAVYLFRRMDMVQSLLTPNYDPAKHRQYIGASGTLPDAVANFKRLTDVDAIHVGAEDNGAPRHAQHILSGKGFAANLADFLRYCVNTDTHQILVFAPSRKKVESLTQEVRAALNDRYEDKLKEAITEYGEAPVVLPEGYVPVLAPHMLAQYARTTAVSETVRILAPAMGPENQLGYWVQPVNRAKFYANRGSWVTVSRETIGRMSDADVKRKTQQGETSVVNRFLSATHITSDHTRARMAMNTASGEFFNVIVDPESHEVSLSPYHTQDDAIRSLLDRKVPRKAATLG